MWDFYFVNPMALARSRRWLVVGGACYCLLLVLGGPWHHVAYGWLPLLADSGRRSRGSRNLHYRSTFTGERPLPLASNRMTATNDNPRISKSRITPSSSSFTDGNILEDGTGHINRELAERIWNWEQERRLENRLPKIEYSVRSGLRLVDSTIDSILSSTASSSTSTNRGSEHRSNHNNSILRGELIQEGLFALLDAMSHYRDEEAHDVEDFATYASREIHRHLTQSLEDDGRPLRLPNGIQKIVQQANRLMAEGWDGTRPTLAQVATKLEISLDRLQDYLRLAKVTGHTLSMESTVEIYNPLLDEATPAYSDQEDFELREGMLLDDGRTVHRDELVDEYVDTSMEREGDDEAWIREERIAAPLQDMIVDHEFPLPDELVLEEQERNRLYSFLSSTLDAEVLGVIRLYFGLDSGRALTVEEIASKMGKTEQDVLTLVEQGLSELRAAYFESDNDIGVEENH